MNQKKIKIGIGMAGAVSAGAYTAGVIDYLMETLERWQLLKDHIRFKKELGIELDQFDKAVPLHDVEIEVLSGASAGGMTASILSYALIDKSHFNKRSKDNGLITKSYGIPVDTNVKSKLYKSWVDMADEEDKSTLDKLLDSEDVVCISEMKSLLNCKPIEEIAKNACPKSFPEKLYFPKYISPELTVYVTVTNLQGIPIDISFSNSSESKNKYLMHSQIIGFKFGKSSNVAYPCIQINKDNYQKIIDFAIATGAYPFGLKPHKLELENNLMLDYAKTLKEKHNFEVSKEEFQKENYTFYAVDGGILNNESYGVNAKHLELCNKDKDLNFMLYIDPFPSVTNVTQTEKKNETFPKLLSLVFKVFNVARNQSMLKQDDLSSLLEMNENRFMIYPRKNRIYFLACGLLGGFSGFLSKRFRQHDYQLGRKNCQAFLRYYFGKEPDFFTQHQFELSQESIIQFSYHPNDDNRNPLRVPLIPDMLFLRDRQANQINNPVHQNLSTQEYGRELNKINLRITTILNKSYNLFLDKFAKNQFTRLGLRLAKGCIVKTAASFIFTKIDQTISDIVQPESLTQKELIDKYKSLIETNGKKYYKTCEVEIHKATKGQRVITVTSTGFETVKIARENEYILTRKLTDYRECYLISKSTFDKYLPLTDKPNFYRMDQSRFIHAIPFNSNNFSELFNSVVKTNAEKVKYIYIQASWLETQVCFENDFIVLNEGNIYRVGKKEFQDTYADKPFREN